MDGGKEKIQREELEEEKGRRKNNVREKKERQDIYIKTKNEKEKNERQNR